MDVSVKSHRRASGSIFRATNIPALLALFVVTVAWLVAEQQNRRLFEQAQRADVLHHMSVIRARLEGNVSGNIQLARGLVAILATEPDMDQRRFSALAGNLLPRTSQIRNFAAAEDLTVTLVYPFEGNEKALGLNYRDNPEQRAGAERARDTGDLVLAGPVDLVQGGRGIIGRLPVFAAGPDGSRPFWGIVSVVVDIDRLYADSGMLDPGLPIDIALSGHDGLGARGALFYGAPEILASDPVVAEVTLPSGAWQIAATPKGGWPQTPTNLWTLRLLLFTAAALIMVPAVIAGRLIEERQRNIRTLRRREAQLGKLSRRLRLALDTSKVAVWEMSIGASSQYWDDRMNELYGYPADGEPRNSGHWEGRVHPDDRERLAAMRAASAFIRPTTVPAPAISHFISSMPGPGLSEMPPVSNVTPLPTKATGRWPFLPPLYSMLTRRGRRALPCPTARIAPMPSFFMSFSVSTLTSTPSGASCFLMIAAKLSGYSAFGASDTRSRVRKAPSATFCAEENSLRVLAASFNVTCSVLSVGFLSFGSRVRYLSKR